MFTMLIHVFGTSGALYHGGGGGGGAMSHKIIPFLVDIYTKNGHIYPKSKRLSNIIIRK